MEAARWEDRQRPEAGVVRATVSIGAAPYAPGDTPASLVERVASALETAQREGGNRVVAANA